MFSREADSLDNQMANAQGIQAMEKLGNEEDEQQ